MWFVIKNAAGAIVARVFAQSAADLTANTPAGCTAEAEGASE